MPCGLLPGAGSVLGSPASSRPGEVQDWLVRTYGRGDDTPTSTVSLAALSCRSHATQASCKNASRKASRHPSFSFSEYVAQEAEDVPRWPATLPEEPLDRFDRLEGLVQEHFGNWSFDTFELQRLTGGRALQFAGWEALRRGGFFSEFSIAAPKAQRFLQEVQSGYADEQSTPYHNGVHAADVTHAVCTLLRRFDFAAYFEPLSALALTLSAIVHDLGHDGRSNPFHVNMRDDLALTYNDRSVLENYHVSRAFKILSGDPEANLLAALDTEQFVRVRKDMIDAVLGTDMAHHFCQVETLKTFVERLDRDPADWRAEPGSLPALLAMVLHAADIANPGKRLDLSDRWTELLQKEFFQQGDEEKRLGLPISPLCDRDSVRFASSQVGFIQFIVRPTFELLAQLQPKVDEVIMKEMNANNAEWEARKKVEEQETATSIVICQVPMQLSKGRRVSATTTGETEAGTPTSLADCSEDGTGGSGSGEASAQTGEEL